MLLEDAVQVLAHLPAALLGHGRNGYAQHLSVRNRIEAQIGGPQGLLDLLDHAGVPGRDQNQLRLGRRDLSQLADGRVRAIVVHLHLVDHMHVGPARPRGGQVGLECGNCLVHPPPQVGVEFLERRNSGHCRDCHLSPRYVQNTILANLLRAKVLSIERTA